MLRSSALLLCCAAFGFGQLAPSTVYTAAWTSATAANAVLQEPTGSYTAALVTFNQTSTLTAGDVAFEGSDTPTASPTDNWYAVPCVAPTASGTGYAFAPSTNVAFQCSTVGFQRFRARLNTVITGSGTVNVSLQFLSVGTVNPPPALAGNQARTYIVSKQTALTAAAEVVTVQEPAAQGKIIQFLNAFFDCTVACSFTLERNGTAATTTALTVRNLNPQGPTAAATAFSASNVGVGTVIGTYSCAAACSVPLDLTGIGLTPSGTGANVTLRSSSITGTVDILFKFREQ